MVTISYLHLFIDVLIYIVQFISWFILLVLNWWIGGLDLLYIFYSEKIWFETTNVKRCDLRIKRGAAIIFIFIKFMNVKNTANDVCFNFKVSNSIREVVKTRTSVIKGMQSVFRFQENKIQWNIPFNLQNWICLWGQR